MTSPSLAPEQVQASLGVLHKAIDHDLTLHDQAGHDAGGEKPLESAGNMSVAAVSPLPEMANLVFYFGT